MKDLVFNWLKAGANLTDGASLFIKFFGKDHPFSRVLHLESPAVLQALKISLCRQAGIDPRDTELVRIPRYEIHPRAEEKPKLREDWPFLREPTCPPELKILASNKITAYHNYVSAHPALFDCTTTQAQFATVKALVENYIENRAIIKEFEFYKQHGRVLGKHVIFKEIKEIRALRRLKILDLVNLKKKLEHNIWRIRSEINKKNKPQLDVERERSIALKQAKLAEIERILSEYA